MNIHDLELRQLLAFREVAERRSFGRAADALGFTQSAVSQQIARLERTLGQSLFLRPGGPKPVELTVAGELLLLRVEGIIAALRAIERDFSDLADGTVGRIAVGTFQSVSVRLLPSIISALQAERPGIQVELRESADAGVLRKALLDHELDLTFWVDDDSDWSRFEIIPLVEDEFVVVAPADEGPEIYCPADLGAVPMIGHHDSDLCQARIDAGLRRHGVEPHYSFRSADNAAVQAMVRAGHGVAVMPLLAVDASDPRIALRQIEPALPPRVVTIATRAGEPRSPVVQRFIELAQSVSEQLLATV